MKKVTKIGIGIIAALAILVIVAAGYISLALPNVGSAPENYQVSITPEKVEHGRYLAYHVMMCMDCHAQRDFSTFSGPPIPSTIGAGGELFDHSMGFPGVFVSKNITPFGIGDWTDGELFRLITTGVDKNGDPIFPVMPYESYGKLDSVDIDAVIAFIRTLEPVETNHPESKADFPFNLIMRTLPKKANLTKKPDPADQVAYGKYLVTAGACGDCHTKFEDGAYTGDWLAGGRSFEFPDAILTSSNLTPHSSGLANWSEEMFVQRFKSFQNHDQLHKISQGDMQTIMPWAMYAGMKEEDLKAIFAFLRTLSPVENHIERYQAKHQ
ncbi:c-type cytochrome [Pleomorphovibrio marinus]|uniref:c-type cytochrome n=1 Tax=Pleomorphovibrio marinus TaxID=2164132 RepID=UPI000E0C0515|nr:cytochrome c [Pleomorphovibrio marinus]